MVRHGPLGWSLSLRSYVSFSAGLQSCFYTWLDRIKILLGAARALEYLHAKGVYHGDFKAHNIWLGYSNGEGEVGRNSLTFKKLQFCSLCSVFPRPWDGVMICSEITDAVLLRLLVAFTPGPKRQSSLLYKSLRGITGQCGVEEKI